MTIEENLESIAESLFRIAEAMDVTNGTRPSEPPIKIETKEGGVIGGGDGAGGEKSEKSEKAEKAEKPKKEKKPKQESESETGEVSVETAREVCMKASKLGVDQKRQVKAIIVELGGRKLNDLDADQLKELVERVEKEVME